MIRFLPMAIVLDNEAAQALVDRSHPKHARARNLIDASRGPAGKDVDRPPVLVPVAVRIEAGWDRTAPSAALLNRLSRANDVVLDQRAADRATRWRAELGVSVVDATVIEAADRSPRPVVILTSDADDMRRAAALLDGDVRVVPI